MRRQSMADKTAQQVQVPAMKPDTLSSMPGTHTMEGDSIFPKWPSDLHTQAECTHARTIDN